MTDSTDIRVLRYVGYGALAVVALWLLLRVKDVLPMFILGLLIAYALDPFLDRLQARGWSRGRAVRFVFLLFFLLVLLLAAFVIPLVVGQVGDFSRNYQRYSEKVVEVTQGWQQRIAARLPPHLQEQLSQGIEETKKKAGEIAPLVLKTIAGWMQGSIGTLLLLILVLPMIVYYLMKEIDPLKEKVVMLIPDAYRETVVEMSHEVNLMFGRYLRGQLIIGILFSVTAVLVFGLWSLMFGMRYALVLGLLAGVLSLIPYLGSTVNFILAASIGYLTTGNWVCAACAAVSIVAINLVFDNMITPLVVGQGIGLHPLIVLFALLAGGHLGGIVGMLVAIPVAGAIKIFLLRLFPRLGVPTRGEEEEPLAEPAAALSPQGAPTASEDGREEEAAEEPAAANAEPSQES